MTNQKIDTYSRNLSGRDFVVGDIHGHYRMLSQALENINFDVDKDRLFSVGDLVDRGPESHVALDILRQPWFHAVRGNHEDMLISYARGKIDREMYKANGGQWAMELPLQSLNEFYSAFIALPLMIEVDTTAGMIGIVHAECPTYTWQECKDRINPMTSSQGDAEYTEACLLWSRNRYTYREQSSIPDIFRVFCGHTIVEDILHLGNHQYIDTGSFMLNGKITICNMDGTVATQVNNELGWQP